MAILQRSIGVKRIVTDSPRGFDNWRSWVPGAVYGTAMGLFWLDESGIMGLVYGAVAGALFSLIGLVAFTGSVLLAEKLWGRKLPLDPTKDAAHLAPGLFLACGLLLWQVLQHDRDKRQLVECAVESAREYPEDNARSIRELCLDQSNVATGYDDL